MNFKTRELISTRYGTLIENGKIAPDGERLIAQAAELLHIAQQNERDPAAVALCSRSNTMRLTERGTS